MIDRRLLALALSTFVAAVDGTLVIGLLGRIAVAVHSSTAAAGQAVTVFALAYAALAPALVAVTRRWPPQRLLIAALGLFVVANVGTALATSLASLLVARTIAGAAAGVVTPTAADLASEGAAPEARGRALAVVVGGASAAAVAGVPLGTLVGVYLGWRVAFLIAAVIALSLFAYLAATRSLGRDAPSIMRGSAPRAPLRAVSILLVTFLWAFGSFIFFTYLSLVVHETASVGGTSVAIFLLVFGAAGVVGALVSGRIIDRTGPVTAAAGALTLVATALGGLALLAAVTHRGATGIALTATLIVVYGFGTWGVTPAQQHRLVTDGGATRLLLSMNASALYIGVALGASVGGAIVAAGHGASELCAIAAGIELAALILLAASSRLQITVDAYASRRDAQDEGAR